MRTIEGIRNIKYFRYLGEGDVLNADDPSSCVYEVREVDEENLTLRCSKLDVCLIDSNYSFPISLLLNGEAEILDAAEFEAELQRKGDEMMEDLSRYWDGVCRDWEKEEAIRNSRFESMNPPLRRGAKVQLVGDFDRKIVNFMKEGDIFYVDDVYEKNGGVFYKLRCVAHRKHSTKIYRTSKGFKEEFLKVDLNPNPEEDYDYRIVDGILRIVSLADISKQGDSSGE